MQCGNLAIAASWQREEIFSLPTGAKLPSLITGFGQVTKYGQSAAGAWRASVFA
jgi:hypothetical protein